MLDAINTNVLALQTQDNLAKSQSSVATSIQRLSSGLRINSAQDDPAGLAIADGMQAQLSGINQATNNANQGVSMLQTADGGYASAGSILQSMRSLAVEAANGTNSTSDLGALQTQMAQLQSEIQQISTTTQYNGISLLDGSLTNLQFQVGANAGQFIDLGLASAQADSIGTNIYNAADTSLTGGAPTTLTPVVGAATVTNGVVTGGTIVNAITATAINISGQQTESVTPTAGEQVSGIVTSINAVSAQTGVTASGSTAAEITGFATGSVSLNLYYGEASTGTITGGTTNSVSINAQVTAGTGQSGYQDLINQINQNTGTTGVTATYDNGANGPGIILSNNTGADIGLANLSNATTQAGLQLSGLSYATANANNPTTTQTASLVGTTALASNDFGLVAGTLQLSSNTGFSVSGNTTVLGSGAANPISSQFASVSGVNLTTTNNGQPSGANLALSIIDSAISQIDTARSNVGAYQNRFTAAVSNLQSASLNLTSSLSTEQDANFAMETTNLSRGQILQQAGTAMLAQANSLPNGVLALLR